MSEPSASCASCGTSLDPSSPLAVGQPVACPRCGVPLRRQSSNAPGILPLAWVVVLCLGLLGAVGVYAYRKNHEDQETKETKGDAKDRAFTGAEWQAEVLESHEPVLVDFWAEWCGPCLQMSPKVEAIARDFKVRKVNVDTNRKLSSQYGVNAIPTLIVFKDGKPVERFEGVTPEGTLRQALARAGGK